MAGNLDGRSERLELEEAAKASEKQFGQTDAEGKPVQKLPKRYKLYDKIAKHLTLRMIDTIIVVTVILIIAAIVLGMITGR